MRPLRFAFPSKRTLTSVLLTASFLVTSVVRAAPTILDVSPSSGPTGGGTSVTVTGTGFVDSLYQRAVTVTNDTGATLTDIQVTSTLDTADLIGDGKMRSDCGDLRVQDSDESTALSYWIQDNTCNTTSTTIWAKIPSLPNGGKTIYLTYGDSAATTTSDGSDVFPFFDDFSGETLNAQWDVTSGTPTLSGGLLLLDSGDGIYASGYLIPSSTIWETSSLRPFGAEGAVVRGTSAGQRFDAQCTASGCVNIMWYSFGTYYAENATAESLGSVFNVYDVTSTARIVFRPGGLDEIRYSYLVDNVSFTSDIPLSGTLSPALYAASGSSLTWDWFIIRQYASTPPVASVGVETSNGMTAAIGNVAATDVAYVNATTLTLTTPAGTAGAKDVRVRTPDGSSVTSTGAFTYVAPAVTITQSGGSTTATEAGIMDTYTVVLTLQPTSTVQILLSTDAQLSLSTSTLDFGTSNWNSAKTITVTALDDEIYEGTHSSAISHAVSSTGSYYPNGMSVSDVTVTITDNDTAAVTIDPTSISATEGGTDSYTVVLNSQPTTTVQVLVSPDAQSTVSTSTIDFTSSNWNTPVSVTVTATDDASVEGAHSSTITHTVSSTALGYSGVSASSVTMTITDNDSAPTNNNQNASSGNGGLGSAGVGSVAPVTPTFQTVYMIDGVVQPYVPVAFLPVVIPPAAAPIVAPQQTRRVSLVAKPLQISRELKPGMRGEDVRQLQRFLNANGFIVAKSGPGSPGKETDLFGAATYQAMLKFKKAYAKDIAAKTTKDVKRAANSLDAPTRQVINEFSVSEDGLKDVYQLVLQSEPTADVTIRIFPDKQLKVLSQTVTFTPKNWNVPRDIVVAAVDDKIAEAATHAGIIRHEVVSEDEAYRDFRIPDLKLMIKDDDKAGVLLLKPKK